ncbi:MAG: aspartyl protease family protein [Acetobacteraceae bacterium]|nr:aspartyl protease family protein [Acetobacteraceae bacterium]
MTAHPWKLLIAILFALFAYAGNGCAASPDEEQADRAFIAGRFGEAEQLYAKVVTKNAKVYPAVLQLGRLALYSNQLEQANKWLRDALALNPKSVDAKVMRAEVAYRNNDFAAAAEILRSLEPKDRFAEMYLSLYLPKLLAFGATKPNQIEGAGSVTRLPFVRTDPLPLVNVRVNGKDAVFFIDTGGAEVILDPDFAKELGIAPEGAVQGTFAAGQGAPVNNARADSIALGDWQVKNLPVQLLNVRRFSEGMGVQQIDGCIGTILLSQFLSTIDYAHGELLLRRKTEKNVTRFSSEPGKNVSMRFWMAGDHFLLARGRVMSQPPAMFFVDTGLAGGGVNLPQSVIKELGINLDTRKTMPGTGGGGTFQTVSYTVPQVSLGGLTRKDVPALYDGPVAWDHAWGFYVGALVGHEFFRPYALTLDFQRMKLILTRFPNSPDVSTNAEGAAQ